MQGEARPTGSQAGHELSTDQGSSSLEDYPARQASEQAILTVIRDYQALFPDVDPHTTARLGFGLACALTARAQAQPDASDDVVAEIMARWVARGRGEASVNARTPIASSPGLTQARFEGLLRHLAGATEGVRNATLFWVACRVGELIAEGQIGNVAAAVELVTDVALGTGLDPREVRGTIRSGLNQSGVTP